MSPLLLLSYIKYVDILNETRAAEDSIKREKYEKSEKGRDRYICPGSILCSGTNETNPAAAANKIVEL